MKRIIVNFYNKFVLISPRVEVLFRTFYWKNFRLFKKKRPTNKDMRIVKENIDFQNIIQYLRSQGIGEGSLLVVHSSYDALERTNLSPEEVVEELLKLVGKSGTLAMPVIRKYKNEPRDSRRLIVDMSKLVCTYDVRNSLVTTGLLPYTLMSRGDSFTSRHPLNPMSAVGALAEEMMKNNIKGVKPSPHGPNSSWKYCLDHHAIVLALGVELPHYLTMIHVAEESYSWPIKDWYQDRIFNVIDDGFSEQIVVSERKPYWGMLRFAERNLRRDLLHNEILIEQSIEGIKVSLVDSINLVSYLQTKNHNGYPYVV